MSGFLLSQQLHELLCYDANTGVFTWKKSICNVRSGDVAGCVVNSGQVFIRVAKQRYAASHLAWFFVTGKWPEKRINHKDGNVSNNSFSNLRYVGHGEKKQLTAEILRSLLHYDQNTGLFTWLAKSHQSSHIKIGAIAGNYRVRNGYVSICVFNRIFRAHRLAWLYSYGVWPTKFIDHINGVKNDNRLCNLRDVSMSGNIQNARLARANNALGLLGVHESKGRYIAQISITGKKTRIGAFDTAQLAHSAYVDAKRIHHQTCTI